MIGMVVVHGADVVVEIAAELEFETALEIAAASVADYFQLDSTPEIELLFSFNITRSTRETKKKIKKNVFSMNSPSQMDHNSIVSKILAVENMANLS